jgi:hypothetical protein
MLIEQSSNIRAIVHGRPGRRRVNVGFAMQVMASYPQARQWLLDEGWEPERIDKYPQAQVAAAYSVWRWRYWADEVHKWFALPYWQSHEAMQKNYARLMRAEAAGDGHMLLRALMPGLGRAKLQEAKLDRKVAALRVIEAIRLHAAHHDGKLPAALDDITLVPIPIDPLSGKPFEYTVDDGAFTLEAKLLEGMVRRDAGLRYEVQVRRAR